MKRTAGGYVLESGRGFYANCGIVGIDDKGVGLTGYDDGLLIEPNEDADFTPVERAEIAAEMIGRWARWGELAVALGHFNDDGKSCTLTTLALPVEPRVADEPSVVLDLTPRQAPVPVGTVLQSFENANGRFEVRQGEGGVSVMPVAEPRESPKPNSPAGAGETPKKLKPRRVAIELADDTTDVECGTCRLRRLSFAGRWICAAFGAYLKLGTGLQHRRLQVCRDVELRGES